MNIVLVSNDRALGRALAIGLGSRGHEVGVAPGVEEALRTAPQPDVLVVDTVLGGRGWPSLLDKFRSRTDVPVVALLEDRWAAAQLEEAVSPSGGQLLKPFGVSQLLACIDEVLDGAGRVGPTLARTSVQRAEAVAVPRHLVDPPPNE